MGPCNPAGSQAVAVCILQLGRCEALGCLFING